MRAARVGGLVVGSALILPACGYIQQASGGTESPSPSASASPSPSTSLGVLATPLAISGTTFHVGEQFLAYRPVTLQATGGTPPYVWKIKSGGLPAGLRISSGGVISGTPTDNSGTFRFTVEVTDAAQATADMSGAISVVPQLTMHGVAGNTIQAQCLAEWNGVPSAFPSGGVGPYSYAMGPFGRPAGTSLKGWTWQPWNEFVIGLVLTDAQRLQAALAVTDSYDVVVEVTDSLGATVTLTVRYYLTLNQNCPSPSPAPTPSPTP